jgi:hypothetical protein
MLRQNVMSGDRPERRAIADCCTARPLRGWVLAMGSLWEVHVKTRSLYGFSPDLAPFEGKTPDQQVAVLRGWGNTAVFGGYRDPAFVAAAHRAGMQVYAEYGCFVGKRWWDEVPASRPITAAGGPLEPEGGYYGVNPSVPEVRRERLVTLERLLTDHEVDGVWLDYIRWPCHWEVPAPDLPCTSFDAGTVARFRHDTGIDLHEGPLQSIAQLILSEHREAWTTWRCDQIASWVTAAREVIDRVRPGITLGLFGVPWRLSDREGAIRTVIGQDYGALSACGVDVFSPMVYHRMCGYPPQWVGEVTAEIRTLTGKPVWPIVQSIDEPTTLSPDEYGQVLDIALGHSSSDGVLVFTMKGALEAGKLDVTIARFRTR